MRVQLTDPGATYRRHRAALDEAVARVLSSGWYILGTEVEAFESEFANALGVDHAIGVANGTDAVELALRGCDIGSGGVVATVSHTAVATVAAIERAGARPVLVDIDERSMTIDLAELAALVERMPLDAVVVVHLYGFPVDVEKVRKAVGADVRIIEDCAQAHLATRDGRPVGSFGDAAAFSFYPTKSLGAFGDGGSVATTSPAVAERVRMVRQYGWRERYISDEPGMNSRLDELQAAMLRALLPHLASDNERRRDIAAAYDAGLAGGPLVPPDAPPPGSLHAYHQYVVRTPDRDDLARTLAAADIASAVLYPQPVHRQPAYAGRVDQASDLRVTERACDELLCLPIGPHLDDGQVDQVIETVRGWTDRR